MQEQDFSAFRELINNVADFYGKDVSPFAMDVWWGALRRFELVDVQRALSVYCQDPDRGQWMPKPADVVRALEGTGFSVAAQAWSKVDRAVRQVGPYRDVVFDDPIIHAVIADMGGWIALCNGTDEEWPFRANEFQKRYQGYSTMGGASEFPKYLDGISNAHNRIEGHSVEPPVAIGSKDAARLVYKHGVVGSSVAISHLVKAGELAKRVTEAEHE